MCGHRAGNTLRLAADACDPTRDTAVSLVTALMLARRWFCLGSESPRQEKEKRAACFVLSMLPQQRPCRELSNHDEHTDNRSEIAGEGQQKNVTPAIFAALDTLEEGHHAGQRQTPQTQSTTDPIRPNLSPARACV